MDKSQKLIDDIKAHADEILRERKRNQTPKKGAPKLDPDLLITLSGCAFRVHKQRDGKLVLAPDEKVNFEKGVNTLRVISYIAGVYEAVSIGGWDWRPVSHRSNRLFLKAIAPTL